MFEKVNPSHPDKIADRIAGAIVDQAYKQSKNPKIAVEVLIGHGHCHIIAEASEKIDSNLVKFIVWRISGTRCEVDYKEVPQDKHLAENQAEELRCGDNGIFLGVPTDGIEERLSGIVRKWYEKYPTDGKFILDDARDLLIACQSNMSDKISPDSPLLDGLKLTLNPLGNWTGGIDVDTGATNRKLGSDMGRAVTGGGLHGKDLSKADVSVNIVCYLLAQEYKDVVTACCAIGDDKIDFELTDKTIVTMPYINVVEKARDYIGKVGGFEKFAEWGLI